VDQHEASGNNQLRKSATHQLELEENSDREMMRMELKLEVNLMTTKMAMNRVMVKIRVHPSEGERNWWKLLLFISSMLCVSHFSSSCSSFLTFNDDDDDDK